VKDDFPFSAVVGQEEAQQALLLAATDPAIGGVLLRGEKGSAKSTLARGLAGLLAADAPFVELPIGATEDRVLGSLDLRAALADGADRFRPGLLAAAHEGVLYVDEVNLLPDHLVDTLLDAAASGVNRVERDGVSHEHPARFLLLGSMNPEEGELRPQLLDRFGLAVEVRSPRDPLVRAEAVRRRLAHDAGRTSGVSDPGGDDQLRRRLAAAVPAALPDEVVAFAARLAVEVGAESLRADLVLCRTAAALAGWEGRSEATPDDVARVAPLALAHRRRRRPFDPPILPPDDLQAALDQVRRPAPDPPSAPADSAAPIPDHPPAGDSPPPPSGPPASGPDQLAADAGAGSDPGRSGGPGRSDQLAADAGAGSEPGRSGGDRGPRTGSEPGQGGGPGDRSPRLDAPGGGVVGGSADGGPTGRWDDLAGATPPETTALVVERRPRALVPTTDGSGRTVADRPVGVAEARGLAVLPTVRAALQRRAADPDGPVLAAGDLRQPVRARKQGRTVVLAVDTSGSMGTQSRVAAATGAVLGLLADAYLRRDQVALVAFRGDEATEALAATQSVELARARLADLPTGGATPLGHGIAMAFDVARRAVDKGSTPLVVLLTDGRATGDPGALDHAREAARSLAGSGIEVVVLDAEDGPTRLGLAAELALLMEARHVRLAELTAASVEAAIRATAGPPV
jgi:magnesium chelatase subunit D